MEHKWKKIVGHEEYSVSNQGLVRSDSRIRKSSHGSTSKVRSRNRVLTAGKNGYLRVSLWRDCRARICLVHRLVAIAFIPNPKGLPCVNHKNCIKSDNRASNLEWVTQLENMTHAISNGRVKSFGENHYKARFNESQIRAILKEHSQGRSALSISREHGTSSSTIDAIVNRRSWKHVKL